MNALVKLIVDEQLNLGLRTAMADVAELVRQLVQDTDGPAPVKSLTELKYPQFDYALPGYTDGSVKTAAEGHRHLPIDPSEEEGTQRMSTANIVALRQIPLGNQETSAPSWEEAQTMVADAAFIDGPTMPSVSRDVDWSAPDSEPPRKGNAVMWAAIALGMLLLVGAVLLFLLLRSSQTHVGARGRFESKSLSTPQPQIKGAPTDPAVLHAAGTRTIEIVSDPPGAAILINGAPQPAVTPAKIRVAATKQALRIKLTKEGYSDHESEFPDGAPSLVVLLTPLDAPSATPSAPPAADPSPMPQETLREAAPQPAKTPRRRRRSR